MRELALKITLGGCDKFLIVPKKTTFGELNEITKSYNNVKATLLPSKLGDGCSYHRFSSVDGVVEALTVLEGLKL